MNFFKKTIGIMVIILLLGLHVPEISLAWRSPQYAKANITKHAPEFLAPPAKRIPVETKEPVQALEKTKTNKWLWIGLGVLAAGALAAAGGGGGGGDSSSGGDDDGITGDITIKWNE
jgi:hypothetical protein